MKKFFLLATLLSILLPATIFAAEKTQEPEVFKRHNFDMGLSLEKIMFKSNLGHDFSGNAWGLSMGHLYLGEKFFVQNSAVMLTGPFNSNAQKKYEYTGMGLMSRVGYSLQSKDIRSDEGSYGFIFGFYYVENDGEVLDTGADQELGNIRSNRGRARFKTHNTVVYVCSGFFFTALKKARPNNLAIPNLITRVEGLIWDLSILSPVMASFRDTDVQTQGPPVRGTMHGYGVMLKMQMLLGV